MLVGSYHRAARKELLDSSLRYSKLTASSPGRHPKYFKDIRRCLMRHFPYRIYYRVEDGRVRIPAVIRTTGNGETRFAEFLLALNLI